MSAPDVTTATSWLTAWRSSPRIGRGLAARSPLAVANAKRTLNAAYWDGTAITAGLRLERETAGRYGLTSADAHEGLAAFAEKRSPRFTGA
jgi:enoyl-CoA hydratase/carnithine racemase